MPGDFGRNFPTRLYKHISEVRMTNLPEYWCGLRLRWTEQGKAFANLFVEHTDKAFGFSGKGRSFGAYGFYTRNTRDNVKIAKTVVPFMMG